MTDITTLQHAMGATLLANLADDDGDGLVDSGVIEEAIRAASAEIGAALSAAGYAASDPPSAIADLAIPLAAERLFLRRRETPTGDWPARAKEAREILAQIASGNRIVAGLARASRIERSGGECGPYHTRENMGDL